MKKLTAYEEARLRKLIKDGKAALDRIETNLVKVEERIMRKRAA